MNREGKIGCICAIVMVAVIALLVGLVVVDAVFESGIRSQCLECGYPDHIVHRGNGYCVQVGSVVIPVDEACSRRIEQGKEKP